MNILKLIPFLYEHLIVFIFAFTRITALFSTFVLFRRQMVDTRIVAGLSVILSAYVILFYPTGSVNYDLFSMKGFLLEGYQFFIGFISGLILNIVFEVFTAVGQIVSTQTGLSLASVIDPSLGNITSLTQFYSFSIIVVFLSLDGHLVVIKTLIDSFSVLPLGRYWVGTDFMSNVLQYSGVIFSGAITLSITIIISILVTNFSLAFMTRFAPQFNLLSIGINLTLILGLICVYFTFGLLVNKGSDFIQQNLAVLQKTIRLK